MAMSQISHSSFTYTDSKTHKSAITDNINVIHNPLYALLPIVYEVLSFMSFIRNEDNKTIKHDF